MSTITLDVEFATETCCNCGVPFAIPSTLQRELRRSHATFYCPHGHAQHYAAKSNEEKLREELEATKRDRDWYRQNATRKHEQLEAKQRQLSATRGVVTRIKNRVRNGVCPCCNRHFDDLQRHMQTKHPHYAETDA